MSKIPCNHVDLASSILYLNYLIFFGFLSDFTISSIKLVGIYTSPNPLVNSIFLFFILYYNFSYILSSIFRTLWNILQEMYPMTTAYTSIKFHGNGFKVSSKFVIFIQNIIQFQNISSNFGIFHPILEYFIHFLNFPPKCSAHCSPLKALGSHASVVDIISWAQIQKRSFSWLNFRSRRKS
jgi:hypothetical protein